MTRILLMLSFSLIFWKAFAQDEIYGKKNVKILSSKAYMGRGYVKRADFKAASYIAAQYRALGLKPLNGNDFFQKYTTPVNYFPGDMKIVLDKKVLKPGVDFLIGASSAGVHGRFTVRYIPRKCFLDSALLFKALYEAENSFALVNLFSDSIETAEEKQIINDNIETVKYMTDLPVAGWIFRTKSKLTWTVLPYRLEKPWLEWKDTSSWLPGSIQAEVDQQFDSAYMTQNICAVVSGTRHPDSVLVISAHYDHLGMMGKKTIFWGANDNASGTGFILSLAKYFAVHPQPYSVVFLSFSGEELGLKGSQYFVRHPLIDLKKIKFLVNIDMAGTGKQGIQIVNSTIFKEQYHVIDSINKQFHLVSDIKLRGTSCNSDHCPFYNAGVPSFFIYTLGGTHYHDIEDTYSSLPFDAWAGYLKLLRLYIESF